MNGWRNLLPNGPIIAMREFRARIGTRSFKLGTLALAVLAFAAVEGSVAIEFAVGSGQTRVAVYVDATGMRADSQATFTEYLNYTSGTGAPASQSESAYAITWLQNAGTQADAERDLGDGKYDALLVVSRGPSGDLSYLLKTDLASNGRQVQSLEAASLFLALEDRADRLGSGLGKFSPSISVTGINAKATTTASMTNQVTSGLLSTIMVVLIFFAIITYGTWVAMGVAEEKGSRVLELMLNAATPLQMLAGKVVGNALAGLVQYGIVIGSLIVALLVRDPLRQAVLNAPPSESPFAGLSPLTFVAFIVLFLLGFLLYSLLYAALGSLVSRQEDVQSATSPLMVLVMVGYFASLFGIQMIDAPWVVGLSYVPFFTPYVMLARVMAGHVAFWEFGLAVAIMLVTIAVALFVAARIYSAGVLMYGQRVGLRQLWKAARVSR